MFIAAFIAAAIASGVLVYSEESEGVEPQQQTEEAMTIATVGNDLC